MSKWRQSINWTNFACGVICLVSGSFSVSFEQWWMHAIGAFALTMGGASFATSILQPKFIELEQNFASMRKAWEDFQPDQASRIMAEAFRARVLAMQRSGEIPDSISIEFPGDWPTTRLH